MARKPRHEEPGNHDRWLVSYADFITLLFAFFVVMYSTSSVNEGKMRVLSDSLVASFAGRNKALAPIQIGELIRSPYNDQVSPVTTPQQFIIAAPPVGGGEVDEQGSALEKERGFLGGIHENVSPGDADAGGEASNDETPFQAPDPESLKVAEDGELSAQEQARELADVSTVADKVRESMSPLIDMAEVALRQKQSWLEIELDSSKLFVSGSARVARGAIPTLSRLADVLKRFPNPIQVEGFTDNIPIRTLAFPSNWELSAARAASVVHLFTQEGIDPQRMVAIGYGEHRPVADNATASGRAKNRRVVLVIPADDEIRRILQLREEIDLSRGGDG